MPVSRFTYIRVLSRLRRLIRNDHLILAFLAIVAGTAAGAAVIGFRETISFIQLALYGSDSENLFANAEAVAWWQILLAPVAGGLVVGLMVRHLMPEGRPHGIADVIEASALKGGWMSSRVGLTAALVSAVSIGSGASVGREGPAVHLGASLAGWIGRRLRLTPSLTRTLLGCGVAAAVLGAPISTTLIIFEMTGDYALTLAVMVAVVIASEITQQFHGRSFFAIQLRQRGIDLKGGFETEIMRSIKVGGMVNRDSELVTLDVGLPDLRKMLQNSRTGELFVIRSTGELYGTITLADLSELAFDAATDDLIRAGDCAQTQPFVLSEDDDLEAALSLLAETGEDRIAIVENTESMIFKGCVTHAEIMAAYNKALLQSRHEEHGI